MKKFTFVLFLSILIFPLAGCSLSKEENSSSGPDEKIIFFYGKTCPHCKIVEKYFDEHQTREKIKFSEKEVYGNKENAEQLKGKAALCGVSEKELGVPFLWDGEKCYSGDKDIIQFFEEKTKNNN